MAEKPAEVAGPGREASPVVRKVEPARSASLIVLRAGQHISESEMATLDMVFQEVGCHRWKVIKHRTRKAGDQIDGTAMLGHVICDYMGALE